MSLGDFAPFANHVWQSTLFVAAVWLLALVLKKHHAGRVDQVSRPIRGVGGHREPDPLVVSRGSPPVSCAIRHRRDQSAVLTTGIPHRLRAGSWYRHPSDLHPGGLDWRVCPECSGMGGPLAAVRRRGAARIPRPRGPRTGRAPPSRTPHRHPSSGDPRVIDHRTRARRVWHAQTRAGVASTPG